MRHDAAVTDAGGLPLCLRLVPPSSLRTILDGLLDPLEPAFVIFPFISVAFAGPTAAATS